MRFFHVDSLEINPAESSGRRMIFENRESNFKSFYLGLNVFDFDIVSKRYLNSQEIDIYTVKVAKKIKQTNANIVATVTTEGYSYENRPMKSLTLRYRGKSNPVVFIDAGIHAREWHSRSLALHIMSQMIHEAERDRKGLIFTTTIIIVANVNPDGYEYSLNVDHMWRKTRRPLGNGCFGVDGNRNFDAEWHLGEREKRPCDEVYRGEIPFSEREVRTVRKIMNRVRDSCFLYITIHTFGNSSEC
jgi:murein tripeptide amidase MpaA